MTTPKSALSHISLGTNCFTEAVVFYDAVLATLGIRRVLDLSQYHGIGYGRQFPEFWIQRPHDGGKAQVANGVHVAFLADGPAQVDAFYQTALAHGARCDGPASPRPDYGHDYYACFVRDLDGHKIEAMAWTPPA
ncbi:VOC family protein [Ottowia testudinis]|uniref:VOC family protein n=1 Tax=Ottowia testudinis TaxID=2816950 RepID=A0A975CJ05_9BURK|nr:VOC family protein [Ottowia testudinis]QTD45862.1 VOC family protein [Ottowia testudinis]